MANEGFHWAEPSGGWRVITMETFTPHSAASLSPLPWGADIAPQKQHLAIDIVCEGNKWTIRSQTFLDSCWSDVFAYIHPEAQLMPVSSHERKSLEGDGFGLDGSPFAKLKDREHA